MGIGIGMVISTCFMITAKSAISLSRAEIETKASSYGMRYPQDMKVINNKDVKK
ncbi:MAG: hypothetical protein ABF633_06545 [Clostridium sp.]|uniref:hypothetical protein n=1 Tax=Clostridium sp. TaxID=1506 RepID=UPI0039EBD428